MIKQGFVNGTIWEIPGGKVDYGESPYDTLTREVMEEVHLSVKIIKPLGLFWFFGHNDDQIVCMTFLCSTDNYDIDLTKNPTDENIVECRWVAKNEFLSDEYKVGHNSIKKLFALL